MSRTIKYKQIPSSNLIPSFISAENSVTSQNITSPELELSGDLIRVSNRLKSECSVCHNPAMLLRVARE